MIKSFFPLPLLNKQRGYILLELLVSILITVIFTVMVFRSINHVFPVWTRLINQASLYDVSHYIFSNLEKNISYDATKTIISKDSKKRDKLVCNTVQGNLTYTFTLEDSYIYKTIKKASTSGKNPLYVSNCKVDDWSVYKISENLLLVDLILSNDHKQRKISKIFYCLNGTIIDER